MQLHTQRQHGWTYAHHCSQVIPTSFCWLVSVDGDPLTHPVLQRMLWFRPTLMVVYTIGTPPPTNSWTRSTTHTPKCSLAITNQMATISWRLVSRKRSKFMMNRLVNRSSSSLQEPMESLVTPFVFSRVSSLRTKRTWSSPEGGIRQSRFGTCVQVTLSVTFVGLSSVVTQLICTTATSFLVPTVKTTSSSCGSSPLVSSARKSLSRPQQKNRQATQLARSTPLSSWRQLVIWSLQVVLLPMRPRFSTVVTTSSLLLQSRTCPELFTQPTSTKLVICSRLVAVTVLCAASIL